MGGVLRGGWGAVLVGVVVLKGGGEMERKGRGFLRACLLRARVSFGVAFSCP